ncbi:MAG: GerMN domain-containing protein [Spirochaetales bacterium]|nr:GerMN domain-containing protein [Spirochaetales bacterium]
MSMKNTTIRNSIFLSGILFGILVISILLVSFFSHKSYAKFIFINKKNNRFSIENRCIPIQKRSIEYVDYLIDDFLLGTISPELKSPFTKNSKRKNSMIEKNNKIYLDFSSSTFNECENIYTGLNILNKTVRMNKNIKTVFLSVDGKIYKYIGNYGTLSDGIGSKSVFTENNIYIDN